MSHSLFSFGSALRSPERIDENSKRINVVVSRYQMVLHPIPRDGNYLFTSIIYALDKATKPAKFCEHLQKLYLVDLSRSLLDRVTNLRSVMVREWLENSEECEPFMSLSDAKF